MDVIITNHYNFDVIINNDNSSNSIYVPIFIKEIIFFLRKYLLPLICMILIHDNVERGLENVINAINVFINNILIS